MLQEGNKRHLLELTEFKEMPQKKLMKRDVLEASSSEVEPLFPAVIDLATLKSTCGFKIYGEKDADISIRTKQGQTVLDCARIRKHTEIVELIIQFCTHN